MPLTSMALSKTEAKNQFGGPPGEDKGPKFPFGLSISLDEESINKLALKSMPKVGDKMSVLATVSVTSVSESENQGEKVRRRVELQITDMALSPEADPKAAADKIYNGKRAG